MPKMARFVLLLQVYACMLQPLHAYSAIPAQSPLFLATRPDPNVMFALSVEFPTAETAAYTDVASSDASSPCPGQVSDNYVNAIPNADPGHTPQQNQANAVGVCYYETQTYLGYFDPAKCYQYSISNGYFVASALATPSNHECGGAWSGNMLNWATMSAIDELRWAMTGGNRDTDTAASGATAATTILKRAVKALGPNETHFVVKRLTLAAPQLSTFIPPASSSSVQGVPTSKVTPYSGNINLYFANTGTTVLILSDTAATSNGSPNPALGAVGDALESTLPSGSTTYGSAYPVYTLAKLNVSVKVCDASTSAVSLETNCSGYTNATTGATSYKPTGLIQQYASAMRFAASSYLFDKNNTHRGGVLRSNMKYVGAVTKDPVNGVSTNAAAEWTSDGVFIQNPNSSDASSSGITCTGGAGCSGVVNYLNQFGYTASDYMWYDVVSELYYESLRYFVVPANGPTKDYVTAGWNSGGVTAMQKDGFPVVTSWQDPIQYACQPNVIVTVGDANMACDTNVPGTTLSGAESCPGHNKNVFTNESWGSSGTPNASSWTNTIGAAEPAVGNNAGLGSKYGNFMESTYYIAGLAAWAHSNDIRKDVAGQSATLGVQNVSSYFVDVREPYGWGAVGGGAVPTQYWLAAKYGGFTIAQSTIAANTSGLPLSPVAAKDWTDDTSGSINAQPRNYLYANNPLLLVSNLTTLFSTINSATSTQASIGANSTSLQSGDKVFQGKATTSDWSGDLVAYDVSASGVLSTTSIDAATLLAPGTINPANRVIFTYNDSTRAAVPFEWSNLSTAEQAALNKSAVGATDTLGQQRLNYLRGDDSNEGSAGGQFRVRARTKLGDIVDSAPTYVGTVKPGGAARTGMVYVGANDGMLHGFSAGAAGDTTTTSNTTLMKEMFAFVPGNLIAGLNQLTAQSYSHQFYVDGTPQVAEVSLNGTATTVLVGSLRGGGQGLFALDVTSPDDLAASETAASKALLWQFTNADDADLGYTFAEPQIVQTKVKDGSGRYRWAAVVGNGYGNTGGGQADLFVLFLDHTPGTSWVLGTDYIKIPTNVIGASPIGTPNGMSTPAVISADHSGQATTVYAGDVFGDLWKFDISGTSTTQWKSALDSNAYASIFPLYVAKYPGSGAVATARQPITTIPEVVAQPRGGYMVLFGTGQAIAASDLSSTAVQSLYGVWDKPQSAQIPARDSGSNTLIQQQILGSVTKTNSDGTTSNYRVVTSNTVNYATNAGWYMDLTDSPSAALTGERVVYAPQLGGGHVDFSTAEANANMCSGGGTGWVMALDPFTGSTLSYPVFDVNRNGIFNATDRVTLGSVTVSAAGMQSTVGVGPPGVRLLASAGSCGGTDCSEHVVAGSNGASTTTLLENDGPSFQRLSWREIVNGA